MMMAEQVAARFVEARAAAAGFPDYPGPLPAGLDEAYRVQSAATATWPDGIAGWKVGRIAPPVAAQLGADRFAGPIFARTVVPAETGTETVFPAFVGGFAAFEAELAILVAEDAPADQTEWTVEEAAALAGTMHLAIEVAGSPLASINDLGPLASIAGFGNNAGLILGPEVAGWRTLPLESIVCVASIDGERVAAAPATAVPGGPLAAFAFALGQAAWLGHPLRRGAIVSTGAITGIIPVAIGQRCEADFGALGALRCRVVPASPNAG